MEEIAGEAFGGLLSAAGVLTIFGSIGVLLYQCACWLRFGDWPQLQVWEGLNWLGLPWPHQDWVGIQKIIDECMGAPLSLGLFISGVAIFWIGITYQQSAELKTRTRERAERERAI